MALSHSCFSFLTLYLDSLVSSLFHLHMWQDTFMCIISLWRLIVPTRSWYLSPKLTPGALVEAALPIIMTNCCMHNPRYHSYYDTNSWGKRRSPPTTSNTPWNRLPRAHEMNIKRYKKKNTQFNMIRSKLCLPSRGKNLRECSTPFPGYVPVSYTHLTLPTKRIV